jgi:formyl-CoA transferase
MDKQKFFSESGGGVGPLAGVRVLDVTTAWAGPMVACVLGDLGCDVVRIDMPGSPGGTSFKPNVPGTELSWAHETVNRNKRSLTVDLRRPEGRDLLLDLLPATDIVVENFKPGTLAGWGVGYEQCRSVREDVIYVSVSGYGQYGPWSSWPGYDPAALATSGWMSLNGAVEGPPNKAPTFLADDLAGLHGAIGALAALHHRQRTGEGQHVDSALLDAILFQSSGFLTLGAMDVPLARMGNQVAPTAPCNTYQCADGGYVYIAIALDAHWKKLTSLMGRPELADDPDFASNDARVANRRRTDEVLVEWCASKDRHEVLEASVAAGIVVAPVNTYHESAREAHVLERDMLVDTTLSDGTIAPITGPAVKFSRTPTTVRRGAPGVGAHTDEILDEFGIDAERRAMLRERRVI